MYENYSENTAYVAGQAPKEVKDFYAAYCMSVSYEDKGCPYPLEEVLFWNWEWTEDEAKKVEDSGKMYFLEYHMRTVKVDGSRYFFFAGTSNDPKDTWFVNVVEVKENGEMEVVWGEEFFDELIGFSPEQLKEAVRNKTFEKEETDLEDFGEFED